MIKKSIKTKLIGQKNNFLLFVIILLIASIVYNGYIMGHYAGDSYNIMNIGLERYSVENNLKDGRPIMYLIDQIAVLTHMSYDVFIISTVILGILFTSITCVIFYNIIIKYFKNLKKIEKILLLLISYIVHFNFMYVENLYFVEAVVMGLTLLFYLLSAKNLIYNKSKLKAILFAVLGTFSYNGLICYYITIVSFLSIIENNENEKKALKDIFISVIIVLITLICNLLFSKIIWIILGETNRRLQDSALYNFKNIIYNIYYIFEVLTGFVIKESSNVFPRYLYMIFLSILIIIGIYLDKLKNKDVFIKIIDLIIISIFSAFIINTITLTALNGARMRHSVGMTIGLVVLLLFKYIKDYNCENKIYNSMIMIFLSYFIISICYSMYLINIHKKVNMIEKQEVQSIEKYVKEYEISNNVEVKYITYVDSNKMNNYYENTRYCFCTNRSLGCSWSYAGVYNFYSGRKLEEIKPTDEINKRYNEANITLDNGIVCINDIMICPLSDY